MGREAGRQGRRRAVRRFEAEKAPRVCMPCRSWCTCVPAARHLASCNTWCACPKTGPPSPTAGVCCPGHPLTCPIPICMQAERLAAAGALPVNNGPAGLVPVPGSWICRLPLLPRLHARCLHSQQERHRRQLSCCRQRAGRFWEVCHCTAAWLRSTLFVHMCFSHLSEPHQRKQ